MLTEGVPGYVNQFSVDSEILLRKIPWQKGCVLLKHTELA